MDGKGRCLDNIFIERLWRSLKYECVYLHAWETGSQARAGIGRWITFYNHQRPHTAHGGQPPAVVYFNSIETDQQALARRASAPPRHGARHPYLTAALALVAAAWVLGLFLPAVQTYPEADAPQLPYGYPLMTIAAMMPPIWNAAMPR